MKTGALAPVFGLKGKLRMNVVYYSEKNLMLNSPKKLPKPDEAGIKNSDFLLLSGEGAEGG